MLSRRKFILASLASAGVVATKLNIANAAEANKMPALDAIMTRRSVRAYTDEAVTDEQVTTLLKAAMAAPSAMNSQSWEFVVVTDKKKMEEIGKIYKYAAYAKNAPLGILTCIDVDKAKIPAYGMQNVSAATQNILLAAHAMGLGAVWTGVTPNDEEHIKAYQALFGLPKNIVPMAYVVIGHPKSETKPSDNYTEAKVHFNNW